MRTIKSYLILLLAVVFTVSTVFMWVGCKAEEAAPAEEEVTEEAAPAEEEVAEEEVPQYDKLKVGTLPFGMGVVFQYAIDEGYYKELGLNVEKSMFNNGALANEAAGAKLIDMAVSGTATVFTLETGVGKLVGETGVAGKIGLYARPDSDILTKKGEISGLPNIYGSKDIIKGKQFLGPLGTSCQLETRGYIQKFGLDMTDIEMVGMNAGQAFQAFVAGEGDVLATWSPFMWQGLDMGWVEVASFEDTTGFYSTDSIFVLPDVLEERRDEVVLFLKATYRACEELQQDKDLRLDFSIKFFADNGIEWSEKDMEREIDYCYYFTKESMSNPDYIFGESNMRFGKFFAEVGTLEEDAPLNIEESFDTSIIKDALGIDVKTATVK